jgi:hypothetical protein
MTDPIDAAKWNKSQARHRKAAHAAWRARINGSSGAAGPCFRIDPVSGEVIGIVERLNEPAASPASSPPAVDETPDRSPAA